VLPHPAGLAPFFTGNWGGSMPQSRHSPIRSSELPRFCTASSPSWVVPAPDRALWLTDIAHHTWAIGCLFVIAGHMYAPTSDRASLGDSGRLHNPLGHTVRFGALVRSKGLLTRSNTLPAFKRIAFCFVGVITGLVAQHMYALRPMRSRKGIPTQGSALHPPPVHPPIVPDGRCFRSRCDFRSFVITDPKPTEQCSGLRMLEHKEAIISHLSWDYPCSSFHTWALRPQRCGPWPSVPREADPGGSRFSSVRSASVAFCSYGMDVFLSNCRQHCLPAWPELSAVLAAWLDGKRHSGPTMMFLQIGLW